ncbi:MAG: ATP-binding protein [Sulfurimonas sp.]|uniref:ATP-binding protein n=1 Tax=Sulfurimonas sp. TaxID=2022749 RepID=UPI00260BE6CE|nr:ATP-binding protein [Sulfurimonas sp.]MDD2651451.1 ATP-binding protein [Sulfurimonas sp.]MDD3450992.1 ATP-binding protein [Sulfurimonas sp.]
MFKSLKIKLLFFFLITNILVLSGFGIFIYMTAKKGVSDSLDTMLKIISIDVIPDFKEDKHLDAKGVADELYEEFGLAPLHVKIIHYDKINGTVEQESVSSAAYEGLFDIPLNEMGHLHSIYYFDKDLYRVSSMLLFDDDGTKVFFQLGMLKDVDSPYLKDLAISLLIANPVILIIFLFIANTLVNRTLQPVKDVIRSVNSISANKLCKRIDAKSIPTEIKELVETFNRLLDNLEESFKRISSFSSDASHELKTPLTVIRGEVEVCLRQERSPQEYRNVLEDVLVEALRVQETIDQLFLLTKKDTAELGKNFTELYLDELIPDIVSQISRFASRRSVRINIKNIIPATIYANETLLRIAIENILRNAIIYSAQGAEVEIGIIDSDNEYLLVIEDHGCGITQEDLPFVFDRFYRADKARSRKASESGTGLGLAIVKMILDIHRYGIELQSTPGAGTKAIIKIPKSDEQKLIFDS